MSEIHCRVCKNRRGCKVKQKDINNCKNFKMQQDNSTWYLEGNSGMRHPLEYD